MAVNGIEIKVGQTWKTRSGNATEIGSHEGTASYPWVSLCGQVTWGDDGVQFRGEESTTDLAELISHPAGVAVEPEVIRADGDGWFQHIPLSDAQPENTIGQRVQFIFNNGTTETGFANRMNEWSSVDRYRLVFGKTANGDITPLPETDPLSIQVAGDHYKKLAIQPVQYIHANKIGYFEGCVIKYVTRWRDKGGIADLEKAKHFIDLLIQLENAAGAK